MKAVIVAAGALLLAACAGGPTGRPVAAPIPFPAAGGPGTVIGRNAAQLVQLFGQPNAEVREGVGRKLQFAGPICVLDAYLYPRGTAEPTVSHVDARQLDGSAIDRASCVSALQRRGGGK